jgi:hypothetical protein
MIPREKWQPGKVLNSETGEPVTDGSKPEYWVCPRVDEPWTWTLMSNQFVAVCTKCQDPLVYRISPRSPSNNPPKICYRCAELL